MLRSALWLWLILGCAPITAFADDLPITNPYLATISGTPEALRADVPATRIHTRRLAERVPGARRADVPQCLPYPERLEYSVLTQTGPAPLTFVIAGTGGHHNAGNVQLLMRALHAAGHHVVGITSPTHPAFIASASSTGVPGEQRLDAADLYAVMTLIDAQLRARDVVSTSYRLTGYSLGGLNAAFLAELDQRRQHFNFARTLLINSPVSLYSSISKLDRFLQNVPGGVDNLDRLFNTVINELSLAYQRSSSVEFSQELIYAVFADNPPTREDMAALIGAVFRFAAMNLTFTADLVTDFGFLKPAEQTLARRADLSPYLNVALRVGLTDYFHEFFWPAHQRLGTAGNLDRFAFADRQDLGSIRDFLSSNDRLFAIHNADDIILEAGEIDFFRPVFGDRVRIFPTGGHLGNLSARTVIEHIVQTLSDDSSGTSD